MFLTATTTCRARNESLVHYPTTLAPVSGSVTVTIQCADNAHIFNSTSLIVTLVVAGLVRLLSVSVMKDIKALILMEHRYVKVKIRSRNYWPFKKLQL